MAWLSSKQISKMNFLKVGDNVLISDKASLYNCNQIEIGDNSRIDDFCVISGRVKIGRNVHIAVFCNVAGGLPGIQLNDFSGLAYGCHVLAQSDDYSGETLTNPTVPERYKNIIRKEVVIGRHCILGTKTVVLPGIEMQEGSCTGAMTLLTKSTNPWSIYCGIPGRFIKNRKKELLNLESILLTKTC